MTSDEKREVLRDSREEWYNGKKFPSLKCVKEQNLRTVTKAI